MPHSNSRFALIFCLGTLAACAREVPPEVVELATVDPVAELERHVRALALVEPTRDAGHPAVLMEVAGYIGRELSTFGGELKTADFEVDGETFRNVSVLLGPDTNTRVVVGAHYDVCGELPGADDNASAVAALIGLARELEGVELGSRVELVSWPLEEPPYFGTEEMGSAFHAAALEEADVEVTAMIALEMVGYFSDEPDSQSFPDERMRAMLPDTGNFITVVGRVEDAPLVEAIRVAMAGASELPVFGLPLPVIVPGVDFSDHRNYWANGFDAVMITDTAFYRNPNYHEATDLPETLDYVRMNDVVKGVRAAVIELARSASSE
jgi:Zn-dependent M28 family amino/carboxypeptidase